MSNFKTLSDIDLLRKIRQNDDHAAFGELYHRYWENLYNNAFKRLKQEAACKDIVQDVFTDIWVRRESLEIENAAAYLHTAVRFQVLKFFAKNKLSAHFVEPFENMMDASIKADGSINEKELNDLLKSWKNTLPKKRLHIYQMHIDENLSTKEIAARLSISQKTVQNQLGTSMQSLRAKVTQLFTFFF
jgi:RNA polymerase sigma-70 factor (family 1)